MAHKYRLTLSDHRALLPCVFRIIAATATGNRVALDNVQADIEAVHARAKKRGRLARW
jgi:hypothetical protein